MESPGHPSDGAGPTSGSSRTHRCDEGCTCPVHGTPLIYWPAGDDHACQDVNCVYGHGMNGDVENLRLLERFFLPLTPEEAAERTQMNRESGFLTRDMIVRALGGDPG